MSYFFKLNVCCCGCSLRTGTLILSWMYIMGAIGKLLHILVVGDNNQYTNDSSAKAGVILTCLLNLGIGICGVYAVTTKKRAYLLPYIILNPIEVVLLLIGVLIVIILAISGVFGEYGLIALPVCIIGVPIAGLVWYFTSVVHSYYVELGE